MADFSDVGGVLCDISGVLKDGVNGQDCAIRDSVEAFKKLQDSKIPLLCCTNESSHSQQAMAEKLVKIGFNVTVDDIVSPVSAILKLINEKKLRPHLLVHDNVIGEFSDVDQSDPNIVVVGDASRGFTFAKLNAAFQVLISKPDIELYALGIGKFFKEDGNLVLDVGAFVKALEYSSSKTATIIGKPSRDYFFSAAKQLGVPLKKIVMIGDDVMSDVGGSQGVGMRGVLVRTGKYRSGDENNSEVKPHAIADNLAQAVDWILANN